jgi:hypothetical protein
MRKSVLLLLLCSSLLVLTACPPDPGTPSIPPPGYSDFRIHTVKELVPPNYTVYDDPNVETYGSVMDICPVNSVKDLAPGQTNEHGFRDVFGACKGYWQMVRHTLVFPSLGCQRPVNKYYHTEQNGIYQLPCEDYYPALILTPSPINVNSLPSTISVQGDAVLNSSFGTPTVDFYNESGYVIGSTTVASISGNGSSASISTPAFLANQYSGYYVAAVSNINADYSSSVVGAGAIELEGRDPIYACGMTETAYELTVNNCKAQGLIWDNCSCHAPCSCSSNCADQCSWVPSIYYPDALQQCIDSCTAEGQCGP